VITGMGQAISIHPFITDMEQAISIHPFITDMGQYHKFQDKDHRPGNRMTVFLMVMAQ
jgi:hypothetical protein